MTQQSVGSCTAFAGDRRVASGDLLQVARAVKRLVDRNPTAAILTFDDATSRPVELDLRGSLADVEERIEVRTEPAGDALAASERRGPGRPRLGVVSREVTLMPRHWAWLAAQRGGASAALRRLVERARRADADNERTRQAQDATYRFCAAIAGNQPGFEEAMRALFAADGDRFEAETHEWPADVRDHARALAVRALVGNAADAAASEDQ